MTLDLGPCIEAAPIPHEVGHVVLGLARGYDPDHTDPRWYEPLTFASGTSTMMAGGTAPNACGGP